MKNIHQPSLLAEIDLLFAPDGIVDVAGDAGWNCYAKAFMSMWLLRLWGEQGQSYEGYLCVVNSSAGVRDILSVIPHAWAGVAEDRIIDMSLRNVANLSNLTVVGGCVAEESGWGVYVEKDRARYEQIASGRLLAPESKFLVYSPANARAFSADSIQDIHVTCSPSLARTLSRYHENLLPKAVLHTFLFAEGRTESLSQPNHSSPWDKLERWNVDALAELNLLLARAKTGSGSVHAYPRQPTVALDGMEMQLLAS